MKKLDECLKATKKRAEEEKQVLDTLSSQLISKGSLDTIEIRAAKNAMQVLVENCIGKGKQILRHFECPVVPTRSRDVFYFMHEMSLIHKDQFRILVGAVGFRNMLIHDYLEFDDKVLREVLSKKSYLDLVEFLISPVKYSQVQLQRIKTYNPS